MISVENALKIISQTQTDFGEEQINLYDACDRVLAEDWSSDRDFPPFDRVAIDGIAIDFSAYKSGKRSFAIEGIVPAGTKQKILKSDVACFEVMTGSVLPMNCNTVIRYEDIDIKNNVATLLKGIVIKENQNVHTQGKDKKKGDILVKAGVKLSSAEIGIGASLGKEQLAVKKLPKVIVVSTGNELVEINETPADHQIRKSNVFKIQSTLKMWGIHAEIGHLNDTKNEIAESLKLYLSHYDAVILSGGVSKGKFDYLPSVLEDLKVDKHFHRVSQRPGKPFWFGSTASTTVFAFPGNPISSFVCTLKYFKFWLDLCLYDKAEANQYASLSEDFSFAPQLTYFLEVSLHNDREGKLWAKPQKGNGSGDLSNLVNVDAFLQLPLDRSSFKAGEAFRILKFR